jgi:hypothetical protein
MTARDRFHATMEFEPLDRPLYWEFGYWEPTLKRWYREGLATVVGVPETLGGDGVVFGEALGIDAGNSPFDVDVHTALGFDEHLHRVPVNILYCPAFTMQILQDHRRWYTIRNEEGIVVRISKLNGSRQFLEFPVKTRSDYERLREQRLCPDIVDRLPKDWRQIRESLGQRTFPLMYGGNHGFFNSPRRYLGFQHMMMMMYDDPELIKRMINDIAELLIEIYDSILSDVGGDCAMISEDMCYKGGCFVSPAMFREFMLPAYRKLTGFYRDHGIRTIYVDCDGDVTDLIPLLVEGGVTGLQPFEVTGKCDIVKVRSAYPRFQILGGIDKKKVAAGKEAIEEELHYKIPYVFDGGGFIPFIDHTVSPDISWENFCYYRKRLRELALL